MALPALNVKVMDGNAVLQNYRQGANDQMQQERMALQSEAHDMNMMRQEQNMELQQQQAQRAAQNHELQKEIKMLQMMTNFADRADTPNKWKVYTSKLAQMFGPESIQGFEKFENRPAALKVAQQALTTRQKDLAAAGYTPGTKEYQQQMMQMLNPSMTEYQKEQLALSQRRADREDKKLQMLQNMGGLNGSTKAYNQKMQTALALNYPPEIASLYASGAIKLKKDPVTGQDVPVNAITGEQVDITGKQVGSPNPAQATEPALKEISASQSQQPYAPEVLKAASPVEQDSVSGSSKNNATLYDQADLITGGQQRVGELASNVTENVPIVNFKAISTDARKAIADFDFAQNNLIRTLSLNPRFPVGEMERIRGLLDRGMFVSPDTLRTKIRSLDQVLRENLATQEAISNDKNMPVEDRKIARRSIVDIKTFLKKLGAPKDGGASLNLNIAPKSIERLKQSADDPEIRRMFDERYGAGAAEKVLGK